MSGKSHVENSRRRLGQKFAQDGRSKRSTPSIDPRSRIKTRRSHPRDLPVDYQDSESIEGGDQTAPVSIKLLQRMIAQSPQPMHRCSEADSRQYGIRNCISANRSQFMQTDADIGRPPAMTLRLGI